MPFVITSLSCVRGWGGQSVDKNTSKKHDNLDSELDSAEHIRIVFKALTDHMERCQGRGLKPLKEAYDKGSAIMITKGIHQRNKSGEAHIQLKVNSSTELFHLDVVAVEAPRAPGRFQWVGTQFHGYDPKSNPRKLDSWPKSPSCTGTRVNTGARTARRMSISDDGIKALIKANSTPANSSTLAETV